MPVIPRFDGLGLDVMAVRSSFRSPALAVELVFAVWESLKAAGNMQTHVNSIEYYLSSRLPQYDFPSAASSSSSLFWALCKGNHISVFKYSMCIKSVFFIS
jgi:hypothetical protein